MKRLSFKTLMVTLLLFTVMQTATKAQVNPIDSTSLVEFYWATGGPNWILNTNWLITPVKNWIGIHLGYPDSTYVGSIELPHNNLIGTLPACLCNLTHLDILLVRDNLLFGIIPYCFANLPMLKTIDLSFNNFISPIPPFGKSSIQDLIIGLEENNFTGQFPDSTMQSPGLTTLNITSNKFNGINYFPLTTINSAQLADNCLIFKYIIPFIQNLGPLLVHYIPQDSILNLMDTTVLQGSNLILDSWIDTCSQNKYSWRKNGSWLNWNSTVSQWYLNNIQQSDSGYYTCQVTNLQCPGLALQRRMIHVHVVDTITGFSEIVKDKEKIDITWRPGTSELLLSFGFSHPCRINAALYNIQGQIVKDFFHGDIKDRRMAFNLEALSPALYLVKIEAGNKLLVKKILIE